MHPGHDPFTFLGHSRGIDSGDGRGESLVRTGRLIAIGLALALVPWAGSAPAQEGAKQAANGSQSGLRVPRFVSLKSNKVNVRRGPSTDQAIVWVFARAGLPVEIIAEADNWRRVRDSEGADGWVFHSLLSGRRTALISPWAKGQGSRPVAQLQSGVLGNVVSCDGKWCELTVDGYSGYIEQEKLWGVYRGEEID
jgi:SH3-like domain-containing protein